MYKSSAIKCRGTANACITMGVANWAARRPVAGSEEKIGANKGGRMKEPKIVKLSLPAKSAKLVQGTDREGAPTLANIFANAISFTALKEILVALVAKNFG